MSSAYEDMLHSSKKRKIQRACDSCRRKKIRCDGPQLPNNRCSTCVSRRIECTYVEAVHRGGYPSSYVESLENRLHRMETLVEKLRPDTNARKELEGHHSDRGRQIRTHASEQSPASTSRHMEAMVLMSPSLAPLALTPETSVASDDFDISDADGQEVDDGLTEGIEKLSIDLNLSRYHGKSSGMEFIKNALELKDQVAGSTSRKPEQEHDRHPWLRFTVEAKIPIYDDFYFPPANLMNTLVDLYFLNINDHLPLLHEPTFKKGIRDGLHLRHGGFGATVLLVCANGARFASDPRVLLESGEPQSAGWKWFQPVEDTRKPPIAPAQLYDLQIYVLMVTFLQGTAVPQSTWSLIGVGIRAAVDVGAHRRNMYSTRPSPEGELWRRAFWILVLLEWMGGYTLGRPPSIYDEDIDLTLPSEVDDEYWTTAEGETLFQQPPGKPSKITSFNYIIRLGQILAFATRTLYSINKSRVQHGRGDHQWEQRIVTELDSALNKWVDSLPAHLRWDPDQPDPFFLTQSATLFAHYYQFQIAVHRPFISPARRDSPLSFPSFIICTSAARSSTQVLDTLYQRTGSASYRNIGPLFMGGIVLVMNVLGEKRSGRTVNAERDLTYVQKCITMLKSTKHEMHVSEVLGEILNELTTTVNAPVPTTVPTTHTISPPMAHEPAAPLLTPSTSINTVQEHWGTMPRTAVEPNIAQRPSFIPFTYAQPGTNTQQIPGRPGTHPARVSPTRSDEVTRLLFGSGDDMIPQQPPHQDSPSTYPFSFQASMPSQPHPQPGMLFGNVQGGGNAPQASSFDMNMDGGSMFGLEPLGYSEAVSLLPSVNVPSAGGMPAEAAHSDPELGAPGGAEFAFLDDALNMWSNAPTSFGYDDWGAYLNNVGGQAF